MNHIGKLTIAGALVIVLALVFSPVLFKYVKGKALLAEAGQTRMIQLV